MLFYALDLWLQTLEEIERETYVFDKASKMLWASAVTPTPILSISISACLQNSIKISQTQSSKQNNWHTPWLKRSDHISQTQNKYLHFKVQIEQWRTPISIFQQNLMKQFTKHIADTTTKRPTKISSNVRLNIFTNTWQALQHFDFECQTS